MTTTVNYSWNLPTVGGNQDAWGTLLNDNWTALDTLLGGVSATELAILDGATVTTAELNKLDGVTWALTALNGLTATVAELNKMDGVTATTAELNILDGVTATAAEINKLDGVTWSPTALNGLTASVAELNIMDGVTSTTAEINKLDGFTGDANDLNYARDLRATGVTAAEFDKLDGLTASTTELNYVDGVTSNIQSQLNSLNSTKAPTASPTFTGQVNAGDSVRLGSWVIFDSGGTIYFQYNGNNVFKVDSSGNMTAEANVTAYGSV
jgi:hypothetical protein